VPAVHRNNAGILGAAALAVLAPDVAGQFEAFPAITS
jgi:hypothetical protein